MTTEFKLVPVNAHLEKSFDVIDGKHLPTIKITLPACNPDDTNAWDRRDAIGLMVKTMLSAAPTLPQPIYDEAAELNRLFGAAREMLRIAGIANQGSNAYNRAIVNLHEAVTACAQSRAKAGEVGHE